MVDFDFVRGKITDVWWLKNQANKANTFNSSELHKLRFWDLDLGKRFILRDLYR